jgi:hypothetical protein
MDLFLEALKWILIVLAAGFIGQFGKSLSTHIIEYLKKRKLQGADGPPVPVAVTQGEPSPAGAPGQEKAEKKAVKAQEKLQKKAAKGQPREIS